MIDVRNHQLMAVAEIVEQEPSFDDLSWYGYDPSAPPPMDDGLSTVNVWGCRNWNSRKCYTRSKSNYQSNSDVK